MPALHRKQAWRIAAAHTNDLRMPRVPCTFFFLIPCSIFVMVVSAGKRRYQMKPSTILLRLCAAVLLLAAGCGSTGKQREAARAAQRDALAARAQAQNASAPADAVNHWALAEQLQQKARGLFDRGKHADAAQTWNAAADAYREAQAWAEGRQRVARARRTYEAELGKYDAATLSTYGGEAWRQVVSALRAAQAADGHWGAAVAAYNRAISLLPAAERAANEAYKRELLADAKANDSKEEAPIALAALDELLTLEPDNQEARQLRDKIARYSRLDVPHQYPTIQKAINTAQPGDTVYVKKGTYNESLVFKNGIQLVGDGPEGVIVRGTPTMYVIYAQNCFSGRISGITFEHTSRPGTKTHYSGIGMFGSTIEISRCVARNCGGYGIFVQGAGNITISDCTFELDRGGIFVEGAGAHAILDKNICRRNENHGVDLEKGAHGSVTGNICEDNGQGGISAFHEGTQAELKNNQCRRNLYGIYFDKKAQGSAEGNVSAQNRISGFAVFNGSKAALAKNTSEANNQDGIRFRSGATGTATENTCEKNGDTGLAIIGNGTTATFRGNTSRENKMHGIYVGKGASGTIEHNSCESNAQSGISSFGAGTASTVKNNTCRLNTMYGVYFGKGAGGVAGENVCEQNKLGGIAAYDKDTAPLIKNNTVRENAHHGIYFGDGAGGAADANLCEKNGWSGIAAFYEGTRPEIRNNRCLRNQRYGINVGGGAGGAVESNICAENVRSGIGVFDKQTAATVKGNQCRRNAAHGIEFGKGAGGSADANTCEANKQFGIAVTGEGTTPQIGQNILKENTGGDIDYSEGAKPAPAPRQP